MFNLVEVQQKTNRILKNGNAVVSQVAIKMKNSLDVCRAR